MQEFASISSAVVDQWRGVVLEGLVAALIVRMLGCSRWCRAIALAISSWLKLLWCSECNTSPAHGLTVVELDIESLLWDRFPRQRKNANGLVGDEIGIRSGSLEYQSH